MKVAMISHGKDSIAMLHVIKDILRWDLDRILTTDVWFDENTRAEFPPMVEWKAKADEIIYDRWGVKVEHICATRGGQRDNYSKFFYRKRESGNYARDTIGFPMQRNPWCNKLKTEEVNIYRYLLSDEMGMVQKQSETATRKFLRSKRNGVARYLGIAVDETNRVERHSKKKDVLMPLVEAGWTEAMCYEWCKENDLLAPTYTTSMRDGCWFCHNQGVDQLRNLYHTYPDLWEKLMKLDSDSPVSFHADGHTVHDFDRRFKWEDEGFLQSGKSFRWDDTIYQQTNIFQFIERGEK